MPLSHILAPIDVERTDALVCKELSGRLDRPIVLTMPSLEESAPAMLGEGY